ncbi:sperm acrosome membrane-associated protein 6 isoform X1 [Mustela erminea]|uniref:sperm acrosome membrane-associated protein 6 isoform X1 n=1 Tax=Mustela erminea TaxID=36723 RepID=UPI00138745C4|nr:sperm acrosome membrane-associated protein 6 isoform X1 [Mustela erminea]
MALLAQDSAVPSALVALMVLRAPAWACLLCFTSYKERMRICQIFIGVQSPELQKCEEAFAAAFEGLLDTEINYDERSHLHDAFTQMTHSLQEMATARGSFKVAFPNAAEKMRKVIAQLKEVQACIPPCGLQEVARRFRCRGCYSTVCDLPLDCPVQDLTVTRGNEAKFSCTVNFELPKEEITYSWKFAGGGVSPSRASAKGLGGGLCFPRGCGARTRGWGSGELGLDSGFVQGGGGVPGFRSGGKAPEAASRGGVVREGSVTPRLGMGPGLKEAWSSSGAGLERGVLARPGRGNLTWARARLLSSRRFSPSAPQVRTQDVSYFQDLPWARGYLARIRPVQPAHRGTFSCVIVHDQIPLARLYFFLNVTGAPPRGETELQVSFREVLRWAPREADMIKPWRPSLGELLAKPEALTLSNQCLLAAVVALASAGTTLMVW